MTRLSLLFVLCLSWGFAQTASNPFEKAPPDVEDALRARVNEFYQLHIQNKYRQAERLVAEESKDAFYAAHKPALEGFGIGQISYSENFTHAKVTIVGKMTIYFLGMPKPEVKDVPFPSYWKKEGGAWCWYVPEEIMRATPFGMAKQTSTKDGAAPVDPAKAFKSIDVETVLSQVSADRKSVKLKAEPGSSENVTITSKMPGTIQLQLGQTAYPGFEVKLDRTELKEGEKAVVSFRSVSGKKHAAAPVRVVVLPTNQPIDIQVLFE